jgi:FkbM family methyltransferase
MTQSKLTRFFAKLNRSLQKRLRLGRPEAADRPDEVGRAFLERMPEAHRGRLSGLLKASQAQLCQDLFALSFLNFKQGGFFVEFGAAEGVGLSNTWLLEKQFGWRGILSEPARSYAPKLRANRGCAIDVRCVWSQSGESIAFREASNRVLSTVARFSDGDMHAEDRKQGITYDVPTVSLDNLLAEHRAPCDPDFLSIDTEGSELEILSKFDFKRWPFKVICCEHAYTSARQPLFELLTAKGYKRVHVDISQFDDWYILADRP